MTLATLKNVERAHGDLLVFSGVSLRIGDHDSFGVVGDNGAGKTTLLRLLTRDDEPDRGDVAFRRGMRIVATSQIPHIEPEASVIETAREALAEFDTMECELRELEQAMADTPQDERLAKRHEGIRELFEAAGGYSGERLCERTLCGLGFEVGDFDRRAVTLSGGEKARLALARAMLRPADLVVFDEPTNHLDLKGIDFLENWLLARKGAHVVVSHDRRFLDRVATTIVEVEGGRVTVFRGNYSAYRDQKDLAAKTLLREFRKQSDFVAKEMAFIRKHMGSRRTAEAKGRLKRLRRVERLAKPRGPGRGVTLRLAKASGLEGQTVVEAEGLAKAFEGSPPLFTDLDLRVHHGDRLGIVGANGTGKSTLLGLLAGRIAPSAGSVERAAKLDCAHFSQEMTELPGAGTVLEAFRGRVPSFDEKDCRDHLARFLFQADEIDKEVTKLSGGEKRRLCLSFLAAEPADILFLDEPTNHLDITTRETLEESLSAFEGTILMVSHDRYFLSRLATRILELRADRTTRIDGGYERYEALVADRKRETSATTKKARVVVRDSEKRARGDRVRNPFAFERLEAQIIESEEELEAIHRALEDETNWRQATKMKELGDREALVVERLRELNSKWENWQ